MLCGTYHWQYVPVRHAVPALSRYRDNTVIIWNPTHLAQIVKPVHTCLNRVRTQYVHVHAISNIHERVHLESCTPGEDLGKMVRTGTYQYVPVQEVTGQYKNSQFVHPVRTFKKSSGFLIHPGRVRRDEIKVVHCLCMGYNVTGSNFKNAQV